MENLNANNPSNPPIRIYGAHLKRIVTFVKYAINFILRKLIEILESLHKKLLPENSEPLYPNPVVSPDSGLPLDVSPNLDGSLDSNLTDLSSNLDVPPYDDLSQLASVIPNDENPANISSLSANFQNDEKEFKEKCKSLKNYIDLIAKCKSDQREVILLHKIRERSEHGSRELLDKKFEEDAINCKIIYQNLTLYESHIKNILLSLYKNDFNKQVIKHIKTFHDHNVEVDVLGKYFKSQIDLCASSNKIVELHLEKQYLNSRKTALLECQKNSERRKNLNTETLKKESPNMLTLLENLYTEKHANLQRGVINAMEKLNARKAKTLPSIGAITSIVNGLKIGYMNAWYVVKILSNNQRDLGGTALELVFDKKVLDASAAIILKIEQEIMKQCSQSSVEYEKREKLLNETFALPITESELSNALTRELDDALQAYKEESLESLPTPINTDTSNEQT